MIYQKLHPGQINRYALIGSVGVHIAIFTAFGFTSFSRAPIQQNIETDAASVSLSDEIPLQNKIYNKPKIIKHAYDSSALKKNLPEPKQLLNLPPIEKHDITKQINSTLNSISSPVFDGVEFFGTTSSSKRICYVVDASGSMQGHFNSVKKRLINSIASLQQNQFFTLIFFRDDKLIKMPANGFCRASTKNISLAENFINSIRPAGTTNALNAIITACKISATYNGKSAIFLLTDGFELTETNPDNFITNIINQRNSIAPNSQINTIGFQNNDSDNQILKKIALACGGQFAIAQ